MLDAEVARRNPSDASDASEESSTISLHHLREALSVEQQAGQEPPLDDLLTPWRVAAQAEQTSGSDALGAAWMTIESRYREEHDRRRALRDAQYDIAVDFRKGNFGDWSAAGHGLRQGPTASGEISLTSEGDRAVQALLPAGVFTHAASQRLNGALRSPPLSTERQSISFEVMGEKTSAVRLITNNCQLNYRNYRALTSGEVTWITFEAPDQLASRRVYAELMTKFDNPKFPDQLGTLGKDKQNDRIPWDQAAADPNSYFGVTHVVLHDSKEPPPADLSPVMRLFDVADKAPQSLDDVANRYGRVLADAIDAWSTGPDRTTDDDVRWLQWMLKHNQLTNSFSESAALRDLVIAYREIESHELSQPRIVPGVAEMGDEFDQPLLVRGDCERPGNVVARRYLEVLAGTVDAPIAQGSGRLQLAAHLASPDNPLTARVMVNRIWHHLFGTGIVRSVDDFGRVGDLPTHPELLDYLATRFVAEGWSVKTLIGEIVRSRTFRLSSEASPAAHSVDPDNRLLSHYPARRLDAESIRDSLLAASDRLDRRLYGMSVFPFRTEPNDYRRLFPGPLDGDGRRSVYLKVSLMEGDRFLEAFNFPGSKVTQGRRDVTNVPSQALTLLNDPFVIQQAGVWAARLVEQSHESPEMRLAAMFQQALGRPPSQDEQRELAETFRRLAELHDISTDTALTHQPLWQDMAHLVFNLKEFVYIP
ncbi:MAG: DUF1553 domain-containing protein, partial [Planctomycetaceae bacterium]|nr:DUF1553 domain-containing protein [Planctomycetaceae bacterium]